MVSGGLKKQGITRALAGDTEPYIASKHTREHSSRQMHSSQHRQALTLRHLARSRFAFSPFSL